MGLLSSLWGSSGSKYSNKERPLTRAEIKQLVSSIKVRTIDSREEELIEKAIIDRRLGDGKISLRQIYEALSKLVSSGRISKYDRDGLMSVFKNHFNS